MSSREAPKKLLIIGSTGQLGRALIKKFLQHDIRKRFKVIATSRQNDESVDHQKVCLDLRNLDSIFDVVRSVEPDLLINASAYTDVERAEDELKDADLINHLAVKELGRVSSKLDIPIVHFSTDYVYAGTGSMPQAENSTLNPISNYAATKLAGERALAQENSRHLIFRTSWIYDAQGKNFPRTILRHAMTKTQLKIVNDQFGSPTSARAIAHAMLPVVDKILPVKFSTPSIEHAGFGIYNLACNGYCSWFEFAQAIVMSAQSLGLKLAVKEVLPVPASEYPTKAKRPLNSRLDLGKFQNQFAYKMPDWRDEWTELSKEIITSIHST